MEKLYKILNINSNEEFAVIILTVVLFIAVVTCTFLIKRYLKEYRVLKNNFTKTYNRLSESEKIRLQAQKERKLIYGDTHEKGLLTKLDNLLMYSGIKTKFKFMSSEIMLILIILVATISIIISQMITDDLTMGLVAATVFVFIMISVLKVMCNVQYKRVHDSVLKFTNIIENFAATSNDIIAILEKSCVYLSEPLKSKVYNCIVEARNSGDKDYALRKLQDSIENDYFKELIRTLRISSGFEANYSEVIREGKEALQNNLKYESEKQSLRNNARAEMLALAAVGMLCIFMSSQITYMTLYELLFMTGIVGKLLFYYMIVTGLVVIYVGFIKSTKR